MSGDTAYYCETGERGITILEYRGFDRLAVIPAEVDHRMVTALAPYIFSAHGNGTGTMEDDGAELPGRFWWSPTEGRISREEAGEMPKVKGGQLEELRLPSTLERVGAYAFYNCGQLKKLELYSTTLDWGAGVFTGCAGVEELVIHVDESRKSCLKEILAELRQTLRVTYKGREDARLIFSEFFEEAVENTPARILVTNTHGCGKRYRNAFVKTQFQFREYDSLFPHVQVQESEALVTELVMGRVQYPYCLSDEHRAQYMEYLKLHKVEAACQAVKIEDMESLAWLTDHMAWDKEELKGVTEEAGKAGNMEAVSFLMNKTGGEGNVKRRRFIL